MQRPCNSCRTYARRVWSEHEVHRFHGFKYIWSFHTRFIKQAFGESYHPYHLHAHPCLNLYLNIQSTIMNVALVQTLLLAHLSRRLIGELIVYPWSGVRRPSVCPSVVVVRSQYSNIFFSQTAWWIEAKFYVEPPWVGGTKLCSRHLGHMTKMAAMPIYGKNPSKIFFSRTCRRISTKLGM